MTPEMSAARTELQVNHVLVPLDGSQLALRAMPTARELAHRFDAVLQTISVTRDLDEAARLRALGAEALGIDAANDRVLVVPGDDPAEVITAYAEELNHCVVCMSTHGRGRLTGAVVGSVARSILQRSRDAIVAVGPMTDRPGYLPPPGEWPKPFSVSRIVACVDGSETSEQVLPLAAAWARALEMTLTILTVVGDVPESSRPKGRRRSFGDAQSYIDALVKQFEGRVSEVDGVVVRDPIDPAGGIKLHLDYRPAGLVAVATHARSGMQRARLGANAARIVSASAVPCLVARVRN